MTIETGLRKMIPTAIIIISAFALAACPKGPQYSEETKEEYNETGQVVMEEWMEKYYPEGRIIDSEPYAFTYPSGPSYLTDFVNGTMFDGEREREFSVNTVTGDVTLEADDGMWEEFQECAREVYLESMDFDKDCEIKDFSASVYYGVLSASGREGSWADSGFIAVGLPGELVAEKGDVQSFVRNPERGCILQVYGWITVPDTVDLSRYSAEDIDKRQEKYGLIFSGLEAFNKNEHLGRTSYERHDYADWEGRTVWTCIEKRLEERRSDGLFDVKTVKPDVNRWAKLEKTKDGYRVKVADEAELLEFILYAQDGDELLEHEYTMVQGDNERKLHWEKTDDGWTLMRDNGGMLKFHATTDLVIR